MEIQKDFRDLFALFAANHVDYMIVGGYALAYYGAPRYTGDMDVWIKPDAENALRVLKALRAFGFGDLDLYSTDFEQQDRVIQLGIPPVRIDLLTSLTGLTWDGALSGSITDRYGDITVTYIGRAAYIINKRATGRKRDLADLEALGEE